jgi:hypothetical protein
MAQTTKDSSSSAASKAFDVIAPGKSAPEPSGRPIIVTNRPMIKDPMAPVVPQPEGGTARGAPRLGKPMVSTLLAPNDAPHLAAPAQGASGKNPRKSIPIGGDVTMPDAVAGSQPEGAPELAAKSPEPPVPALSPSAPAPKPDVAETTQAQDSSDDGGRSADVPFSDNAAQRAEKEQAARAAEQEKIIASKQYYLPITTTDGRRDSSRAVLVLVLVLVAVLAWLDITLDAGIVHLGGIHALTHFFH